MMRQRMRLIAVGLILFGVVVGLSLVLDLTAALPTGVTITAASADDALPEATTLLEISKTADPAPDTAVFLTQTISYTINVSNTGGSLANVTVTDPFPYGLTMPECDGQPGDLQTSFPLDAGASQTIHCTTVVSDDLFIELSQSVDQPVVNPGTAVTYTITVTNHHPVDLENVYVTGNHPTTCSPGLGAAFFDLPVDESVTFVCPNILVESATAYTATVIGNLPFINTATASAPEASNSPVESNPAVIHIVPLQAVATTPVLIGTEDVWTVYLPLITTP